MVQNTNAGDANCDARTVSVEIERCQRDHARLGFGLPRLLLLVVDADRTCECVDKWVGVYAGISENDTSENEIDRLIDHRATSRTQKCRGMAVSR